jgi:hypothetical protein
LIKSLDKDKPEDSSYIRAHRLEALANADTSLINPNKEHRSDCVKNVNHWANAALEMELSPWLGQFDPVYQLGHVPKLPRMSFQHRKRPSQATRNLIK